MDAKEMFLLALARTDMDLRKTLEGLTSDDLINQAAGPKSNPAGWLLWHLTMAQDNIGARISGEERIWVTGSWHDKFGLPVSPQPYTPDTVKEFDPNGLTTLMEFYDAVYARTQEWASQLIEEDFEREIPAPPNSTQPPRKVKELLAIILNDNIQHIGQIAYLRGMIHEQGWY